jgi:hypothetical protein
MDNRPNWFTETSAFENAIMLPHAVAYSLSQHHDRRGVKTC